MTGKNNDHLNEDRIIRAIIDEGDLPDSLREHLGRCNRCQTEKERLEHDLDCLGRMAKRFSPLPDIGLALSAVRVRHSAQWFWRWQTALGAAMVAAIIVIIWWSVPERSIIVHPVITEMIIPETWGVDSMMIETSGLSENVLPQVYLDISGETESGSYEEFIEFVVPLTNNT